MVEKKPPDPLDKSLAMRHYGAGTMPSYCQEGPVAVNYNPFAPEAGISW